MCTLSQSKTTLPVFVVCIHTVYLTLDTTGGRSLYISPATSQLWLVFVVVAIIIVIIIITVSNVLQKYYVSLLRPGRGAEYRDQLVCVFVCVSLCLSVREHITVGSFFTIFCADPLWPWLRPLLAALR